MWDWKVPSQSYCQLPGPWESLGIYYVDQSGSGRTGEVNVYESDSQIAIPSFIAIGRAVEQAGSAVDISQGSQPANPPASTVRLWADGSGNLHYLSSSGVDKTLLDTTTPLGADLYGTISNAHIAVRNGASINLYDVGGTSRIWTIVDGANNILQRQIGSGAFFWQSVGGAANLMSLDPSAALTVYGTLNVSGANYSTGWIYCAGYPTISWDGITANIYNGLSVVNGSLFINKGATNSAGAYISLTSRLGTQISIYDNGGGNCFGLGINSGELSLITGGSIATRINSNGGARNFIVDANTGNVNAAGQIAGNSLLAVTSLTIQGSGYIILAPNTNNAFYWDNSSLWQVSSLGNPATFRFYAPQAGRYFDFHVPSAGLVQLGGTDTNWVAHSFNPDDMAAPTGNGFMGPRRGGAPTNEISALAHLYVAGSVWCTNVQNISERGLKQNLEVITSDIALGLILNPLTNCYRYDWVTPVENSPDAIQANFGFVADEINKVCPEVVALADGVPSGVNYTQLVPILWSAVRNLNDRITKLELSS
jgi:hypothetical protein